MNSFLLEGSKIFFRVGLAAFKLHKTHLKTISSSDKFLSEFTSACSHLSADVLLRVGFEIQLSRQTLQTTTQQVSSRQLHQIPTAKIQHFHLQNFKQNQKSEIMDIQQVKVRKQKLIWKHSVMSSF